MFGMLKKKPQFTPKSIAFIASWLFILGLGYWLGFTHGVYRRLSLENMWISWHNDIINYQTKQPDFMLYTDVVQLLGEKYYGDINFKDLLYGSIKGAVASLGDHYTSFSTPAESKDFFTNLNGIYEGVGIEIDYVDDRLLVVAPLDGSPAKEAGIKPKDEILFIDGASVLGLALDQAVNLIQGIRGTEVTLIINREGEPQLLEFKITRNVIKIPSVKLDSFVDGLAVVEITKFSSDSNKLFNDIVRDLLSGGVKGMVLDMRNNPGGFLDVGVKIANEFISNGMIVEERFKDGKVTPFYADASGRLTEIPIVVLINGGSASAAEIVAGALKDNDRAILVGENTYGKGSVQEIDEMPDGSALRLTVAHWYTPSGRSISQGGIKPDILIKEGLRPGGISDPEGEVGVADAQLSRAIEELKKLIK
ncbi:S41 family peptidase [Patescibacteria group bacterium]|nr:S41 family peptidase [Patescibacteria group bacterium]